MPIKTDDDKRWVEVAYRVHGEPEQVWRAIATGDGLAAWFTPATVDGRVGGAIEFDLGGGTTSVGTIAAWEPNRRMVYEERGWSGDAPPLLTEVTVTARSGGSCVVRMVHSLFTRSDAWDDEMEGFERGWRGFFDVLDLYLREFAGQPAAATSAMAVLASQTPLAEAWRSLTTALGIEHLELGERRATAGDAPRLAGSVEHVHQVGQACDVLLRLVEPTGGAAILGVFQAAGVTRVSVNLFFYGDRAAEVAARAQADWAAWMSDRFA